MERLYHSIISCHLEKDQQMIFLAGPRQVGKTTISRSCFNPARTIYLNWDVKEHRPEIIAGPVSLAAALELDRPQAKKPLVIFDELHKYKNWRDFIKGFYDLYKDRLHIIVMGSAKFDIYRRGGDSLMGRYFPYHVDPLSVRELISAELPQQPLQLQQKIDEEDFVKLWQFGGFPDPYLKSNNAFLKRWQSLRHQQLFDKDIQNLTNIQELDQLEVLAVLLKNQAGQLLNYANLAQKVGVSINTIKRWIATLKHFYFCFTIKPWSNNIPRSLLKEPKAFLYDWSEIQDIGPRVENFVACHLLKAVHCWNDLGFGDYQLFFIRDKEKNEVDFLVVHDSKPWVLVEVKKSANHSISKSLHRFQEITGAKHALQVVFDLEYEDIDCFNYDKPVIVPLQTFLSQLV